MTLSLDELIAFGGMLNHSGGGVPTWLANMSLIGSRSLSKISLTLSRRIPFFCSGDGPPADSNAPSAPMARW